MKSETRKISAIKKNPANPRIIKDDKFEKLVKSIKSFPEMLEIRPIVINSDGIILGGNMRLEAAKAAGLKEVPVIDASHLDEDQQREFIIKDNVGFGEWDWEMIANDWDAEQLDEWGLDVPNISETEKLSEIKFEDIYYEPEQRPNIILSDCLDLTKYKAKIQAIDHSDLNDDQKEVLKMFAHRFIKIDFQRVADYYFFNATEEEKIIMERLRLVLCDSGLHGFIMDDLLRVNDIVQDWEND